MNSNINWLYLHIKLIKFNEGKENILQNNDESSSISFTSELNNNEEEDKRDKKKTNVINNKKWYEMNKIIKDNINIIYF